jgi:hypothetical protein
MFNTVAAKEVNLEEPMREKDREQYSNMSDMAKQAKVLKIKEARVQKNMHAQGEILYTMLI